ncbi:MAG: hypothetical protein M1834_009097 [Cirrosporium novae-zelandiae]|nr:MAG: hypothetical protein M1834_003130 [Cirrosporium novae-zelandiae]KAI9737729.1 MAG: hypothetical protein M1834_009097 [Cirrosporium novae-zelandiae]
MVSFHSHLLLLTLTLTLILLTFPPSVQANGCYTSGLTWSDVGISDSLSAYAKKACNSFKGSFHAKQSKRKCYNTENGDRVNFVVKNRKGVRNSLTEQDCHKNMLKEMKACDMGSEQDHGEFFYRDDPNGGKC